MSIEQYQEYKKSLYGTGISVVEMNKRLTPLENEIGQDLPEADNSERIQRHFLHVIHASKALLAKIDANESSSDESKEVKEALKLAGF